MIELIRADQYTKMLWKNGAGFTLEIARSQGEADFEWRISMADVTTSGPFSLFPNKQRIISVLDGQGMVLHVDDLPAKKLKQGDIFAFHGESQVQSELVDGAIRDLNLIYDPAKFHARFSCVSCLPAGPRSWGGCWASFTASLPRTWSRKRAIPTKWPRRARSP